MKLNIKNLKGEVFQVEVEPADNISTLKNKIQEAKNIKADSLKLVFKGKNVNNEDSIEKLAVKETDFIVVMSQVAKPAPKAKEQKKTENSKEQKKEQKKEEEKKEGHSQPQQPQLTSAQQAQASQLISMGFPRQQCVAALRAAFFNTETAVEYLCTGIPAGLETQSQFSHQGIAGLTLNANQSGQAQMKALFNHPNFAQLRDLIRANPAAIQPILAQIRQSSPQIYNLIIRHPAQFERILQCGDDQEQDFGEDGFRVHQVPAPGTIFISAPDESAIDRLKELGFSKAESAQAYFACGKNEDMAANLLFDRLANGEIQMEPQSAVGTNKSGNGGQGASDNGGSGSPKPKNQDDDNLFN